MFARVAVYEIPGHRMDEAIVSFGEAINEIRQLNPEEIFLLVSRDSDRALTMSLWNRLDEMAASRVKASGLRGNAAGAVDGSVQSVVEFEVAIHESMGS
jgi:hypothetical protein